MFTEYKDITIVVPVYNKESYIVECLDSIKVACKNHTFECIVINDYSTDNSEEILEEYCNNNSDNYTYIKCLQNHIHNPSYARNIGLSLSNSKYIYFLDADDTLLEGYLDRGIEHLNNHDNIDIYLENWIEYTKIENSNYLQYVQMLPTYYENIQEIVCDYGGAQYHKGIIRNEKAKQIGYKELFFEDGIFILDFVMKFGIHFYANYYNDGINFNIYRSNQTSVNIQNNDNNNGIDYIINYANSNYPDWDKA